MELSVSFREVGSLSSGDVLLVGRRDGNRQRPMTTGANVLSGEKEREEFSGTDPVPLRRSWQPCYGDRSVGWVLPRVPRISPDIP